MANNSKKKTENNLLKIREKLGYTQKEMGKILDVSERMICNYEIGEVNLPIDKAILLSEKYNYSLDWIYKTELKKSEECSIHKDTTQLNKFVVDIRDFISFSNNMYNFNIPNNYWKYIQNLNIIISSNKTDNEKKRQKAELDGNYKKENRDNIVWRISIPKDKISSYIHFDSDFITFVDSDGNDEFEPTEEQLTEAISFFNELTMQNENET